MRKGIQIKTIRNLNLDHPGGKCQILTIRGENEDNEQAFLDQVVRNLNLDHPGGNAKS